MSKTPFEVRLELLQLAQTILNEKAFAEKNRLEQDWFADREIAMANHTSPRAFPKAPTVNSEDLIELAQKLNEFVSNG